MEKRKDRKGRAINEEKKERYREGKEDSKEGMTNKHRFVLYPVKWHLLHIY
jgi:hypothetical protein